VTLIPTLVHPGERELACDDRGIGIKLLGGVRLCRSRYNTLLHGLCMKHYHILGLSVFTSQLSNTNLPDMPKLGVTILRRVLVQIHLSEGRVLRAYHPDADDLYNVRCDLKLVIEELKDRNKRALRKVCTLCLAVQRAPIK
jgi:hypothetical protein